MQRYDFSLFLTKDSGIFLAEKMIITQVCQVCMFGSWGDTGGQSILQNVPSIQQCLLFDVCRSSEETDCLPCEIVKILSRNGSKWRAVLQTNKMLVENTRMVGGLAIG